MALLTHNAMLNSIKLLLFAVVVVLLLASCLIQLHFVIDGGGVTAFQKNDDVYLFVGEGHTGWRFPAIQYPFAIMASYLNVAFPSSDTSGRGLVLRVSPQGVQRFPGNREGTKPLNYSELTPFGEDFYALCPGAVLCKWNGRSFAPATADEQNWLPLSQLHRGSYEGQPINGWTAHALSLAPGSHFEFRLSGSRIVSVRNQSRNFGYPSPIIELQESGLSPQILFRPEGDGSAHLVSK